MLTSLPWLKLAISCVTQASYLVATFIFANWQQLSSLLYRIAAQKGISKCLVHKTNDLWAWMVIVGNTSSFLWSESTIVHAFDKDTISGCSNWGQAPFLLLSNCLSQWLSFPVPQFTHLQRQSGEDFPHKDLGRTSGVLSLLLCSCASPAFRSPDCLWSKQTVVLKESPLPGNEEIPKCLQDGERRAGQSVTSRVSNSLR